jgi:hypothetical protein
MAIPHAFLEALPCSERAPELLHEDDLFGYLVGSWELEAILCRNWIRSTRLPHPSSLFRLYFLMIVAGQKSLGGTKKQIRSPCDSQRQ